MTGVSEVGYEPPCGDVRPVVLGYISSDPLTTERELAVSTAELAAFAEREGYALGTVFIERSSPPPAAFAAMLAEAARTGVRAVVMPGPVLLACATARVRVIRSAVGTAG